jgi:hypothetical protein
MLFFFVAIAELLKDVILARYEYNKGLTDSSYRSPH